jgi:hypothetical protein
MGVAVGAVAAFASVAEQSYFFVAVEAAGVIGLFGGE